MEAWFRCLFRVLLAVAGILAVTHLGLALWAQNEFTGPESVVTSHSLTLAREGALYYPLNSYPYTVSAYTPLFYLAEAGLHRLGVPARMAGRCLSMTAWLILGWLVWRLLMLHTRDPVASAAGLLLFASNGLLLFWGTVGQVDVCATALAVGAFYMRRNLAWAALLCCLAFFTKQTMVACPIAIFLLLWFENRRLAAWFGAGVAGSILAACLTIDAALGGRFIDNTVRANINPFALEKFGQHLGYLLRVTGPLILVIALGLRRAPVYLYAATAALVFLGTAGKVGSDLNYQIEITVLCVVCASLALHSVDFFHLSLRGSKNWVTLLQIPLGVYLIVNLRLSGNQVLARFANEQAFRSELIALQPYQAGSGRLLSADYNAAVQLRGHMEVETLIYTLLVRAGEVDPKPLQDDLAAGAFGTILLFEDLSRPVMQTSDEILSLTKPQIEEIRKGYKLVAHVPGPYLNGVYVYQPNFTRARRLATPAVPRQSVTVNETASSTQSCAVPSGSWLAAVNVYSLGHRSQRKRNSTRTVSPAEQGPTCTFSTSVLVPYTSSPKRVRIMTPITGLATASANRTVTRTADSSPLCRTAVGLPLLPTVSSAIIWARPSPLRRAGARGMESPSPQDRNFDATLRWYASSTSFASPRAATFPSSIHHTSSAINRRSADSWLASSTVLPAARNRSRPTNPCARTSASAPANAWSSNSRFTGSKLRAPDIPTYRRSPGASTSPESG